MTAVGLPDTVMRGPQRTIEPYAWSPKSVNRGEEWLELEFETAMSVTTVRVWENAAAGTVAEVVAILEDGAELSVWQGRPPPRIPGVFTVEIEPTTLRRLRIVIDTGFSPGINQIDAVQIEGPDGSQWAVSAKASSERDPSLK